ncbi:acyl-CoA thioesterase [bacterium]|nr:acyl-CoA thioesterase [bacterium]
MRWIRLLFAILSAKYRSKLTITEESNITFRVWLTDVDASVMNHATMMTVMEMGRIDFMVRSGFFKLARKRNWYFPLRSIGVQFIRPLKLFQKANLTTKVFHVDERWIYLEQKITRHGKDIAICIVKVTVKKGKETISTNEIAKALGIGELPTEGKQILDSYEKEDNVVYQGLRGE